MSRASARVMNEITEDRVKCERCNRRAPVSSLQVIEDALCCWLCLTGSERGRIYEDIRVNN